MGTSNGIKMDKRINLLRNFQLYENSLYSYFSYFNQKKAFLIENLSFYLVPKDYIIEFCKFFDYKNNFKDLEQLNIYCNNINEEVSNKKIVKQLINNLKTSIKSSNPSAFTKNEKLQKIVNRNIIKEKKGEGYIFKLNKDGLFIPLTYAIWVEFIKYYKVDIELKMKDSFSNNGELFIITEENKRLDTFFLRGRTKDIIHHYCFIVEKEENFQKNVNIIEMIFYWRE